MWLQSGLPAARMALGERWNACYMSAPIWRFTLSPAVAGRMAVQGVLMPSVDRVGRGFPLTLMWLGQFGGLDAHLAATSFFEKLEDVALSALDDRTSASLAAELNSLTPTRDSDATLDPDTVRAGLDPESQRPKSIWTAVLESSTRLLGCPDLPNTREMCGLFDLTSPIWPAAEEVA